ncbi:MAG: c-type cytochrome, partial [Planctomycetota bacterium]
LTGPDGNVFVLDWSDTGECHEHDGVHRTSGRIYKIKHCDAPERKTPDISTWKLADWMAASLSSRSWDRRIAIRHLHHSSLRQTLQSDPGYAGAVADLRRVLADTRDLGTASQTRRMRALMTLHALGEVDTPVLLDCLQSACETVRTWAIRLSSERWLLDDAMGAAWKQHRETTPDAETLASMLPAWLDLARHDGSAQVRLNLASLLQRLPVENRAELASALVSHASDAADHNIPRLIWYGLIPLLDEAPEQLVDVLVKCRLPDTSRLISRGLGEWLDKHPDVVDRLLAAVADLPVDCRSGAVDGFVQAMRGRRSATPPRSWPRLADAVGASDPRIRDLQALFGDGRAVEDLKRIVSGKTPSDDATRMAALETLIRSDVPGLRSICEKQLKNAKLNVIAASGLATIDDPEVGRLLVSRYRNFRAPQRPKLIAMLVRRAGFVGPLLDAIEAKKVPRTALSAYDVRQIHALGDAELSAQVTRVWGEVRRTSAEKTRRIEALKESLDSDRLAAANLGKGRTLFQQQCQSCHKLYGEGEKVGPDLTGAGRQNLDYLLSNIVAPSSVVDKDYRLTLLMMDDGRVISGLVLDQNATAVVVQTATEKLTLPAAEIERQKVTEKSPMPEGLLATMTDDQIADLIAYLQHPTQVEAVKLDD